MKKIFFLIDSLVMGGAQRQLVELAINLDRTLFAPAVVIYFDIQQLRSDLEEAGIPVYLIEKKSKFDVCFLFRLIRFLKIEKPDILQSYLNTANFWARIAGWFAGVRHVIISERSGDVGASRSFAKTRIMLEKMLQYFCSRTVCNSEYVKSRLIHCAGVNPKKIHVIYNGVDVRKFNNSTPGQIEELRATYGITTSDFVIALVGRIAAEKNHACLIRAISKLGELGKNVRVLFVGNELDIELKNSLRNEIAINNLEKQIIFAGAHTNMAAIYAVTNVVVLPSIWESFPNVILEAMAAGRPVVASDISDNRFVVQHRITGYLFENGNSEQLATCLRKLICMDAQQLRVMGETGKALARYKYSNDIMVGKFKDIYVTLS